MENRDWPRVIRSLWVGSRQIRCFVTVVAFGCFAWDSRAAAPSAVDLAHFESRVRPVLVEHCYPCHSAQAEKLKGGLSVDSLAGLLRGGELGPAIVPGDAEKSLLIRAVRHSEADLEMPPKGKRLSERQIADLAQWVNNGAPWPDSVAPVASSGPAIHGISPKSREWWAFQPIRRPSPMPDSGAGAAANPIDRWIRTELQEKGIQHNPIATPRERIRRAYFDLIGLPPTPEQIRAFERDPSPDAWERLIDQLLMLPQYGERWGRHWLDVVRFAQSNGYERDGEKPEAWRYRDYVVKAFNEDKPYDQFIREQIAGDELDRVTFDSIIATGFQRLGVMDDEPDDRRMAEFDELDDVLSTTGTAFLGLTIGCARCHDHKFDPILQTDYYSLLSFFRNLRLSAGASYTLDSPNYVPLVEPATLAQWRAGREVELKGLQEKLAAASDEREKKKLTQQIEGAKGVRPPFEFALAVRERGSNPPPTHVLIRGNAGTPGAEVEPAFLTVLADQKPTIFPSAPETGSSGRRRALADWIASPANPLTGRVMVNRVWQHHFGRGLVKTTSDFGRAGVLPTHPKLLDWLAAEFIEGGWSIKKLHKIILLSQTYQMSSGTGNSNADAADPGNDLLWRQNLRRLEAEPLRDTMLALSGRLNPKMGGRGFFPGLSGEVLAGQSRPGLDWDLSSAAEGSRRSLYAYVRRTMAVPMLDAFDYSNTTSPLSERSVTTVAPQSLLMLNDQFMQEQARSMAARLTREVGVEPGRFIRRGFQLAVGRDPSEREREVARSFLKRQQEGFRLSRTRLTFRPDVPASLSVNYLEKLKPKNFLIGPDTGWNYYRGRWSGAYEGIRTMERDRGPFALLVASSFSNGVVDAKILLHTASESAGVLFRGVAVDDDLRGYEVSLAPREQQILLRRHSGESAVLAKASVRVPTGQGVPLRIEAADARIRVWIGDDSRLIFDVMDPQPLLAAGRVGVRCWGSALSVDDLIIHAGGVDFPPVFEEQLGPPERRALEAFCLLLLNLNEVVYID